jgi:Tfp pilus assembly protein PilO
MINARLVRFAAVLVVLIGYLVVFHAGEQRLGARIDANAVLAAQLRDANRMLASRPVLEAERTRLRERLRRVDLDGDRSSLTARFVHAAARIALTNRTTIATIAASGSPGAADAGAPFETIPLELAVEGRYVDVLATIRALSSSRVLASVDVVSLARKNADAGDATLVATLRVLLERLAPAVRSDARARPA